MNEREALLERIFDNPEDDAPRLIYSDWAEENDEPFCARFIRTQIHQARGEEIEEAEIESTWSDYLHELDPENNWSVGLTRQSFERGFPISPLNVSVNNLKDQSRYWWPRVPVIGLICPLSPLTISEFVRVPYLTKIRELIVDGQDPHGLVIPRLAQCHYLRGLRILDLSMYTVGIEAAEALAKAEIFDNLRELRLPYSMRPNREAGRLLRRKFGDVCLF